MDVFLIPVGHDRYELYCETPDEDPSAAADHDRGFFRGLIRRFREMLASAERERQSGPAPDASSSLMARPQIPREADDRGEHRRTAVALADATPVRCAADLPGRHR
jgi:hypothetical protein